MAKRLDMAVIWGAIGPSEDKETPWIDSLS